jgi:hypothetical protein
MQKGAEIVHFDFLPKFIDWLYVYCELSIFIAPQPPLFQSTKKQPSCGID